MYEMFLVMYSDGPLINSMHIFSACDVLISVMFNQKFTFTDMYSVLVYLPRIYLKYCTHKSYMGKSNNIMLNYYFG